MTVCDPAQFSGEVILEHGDGWLQSFLDLSVPSLGYFMEHCLIDYFHILFFNYYSLEYFL